MTFSSAVSAGKSWKDWNTKPTIWPRSRARPSSSRAKSSSPPIHTRPDVGTSSPASSPSRVDLPEPDAPRIATASPGRTSRLASFTMVSAWSGVVTCLVSPCALTIESDESIRLGFPRSRPRGRRCFAADRVARRRAHAARLRRQPLGRLRDLPGPGLGAPARRARRPRRSRVAGGQRQRLGRDHRRGAAPALRGPRAPQALDGGDRAGRQRRAARPAHRRHPRQPREDDPPRPEGTGRARARGNHDSPELWHRIRGRVSQPVRADREERPRAARALPARGNRRQARPLPGRPAAPDRGRAADHPGQRLEDARAAASQAGVVNELPFHRERPDAKVATPLSYWELRTFDDVLDARSPAEYAEDHLPEAISVPVLDDAERAMVCTVYKQRSAFEAKRAGAPIAARNIARHIEERFRDKPRNWKPLVYCWRGGGRSGSLVHVLRQVGWVAQRLDGGYKAFRRQVVAELDSLPLQITLRVVCGPTGSGKSRFLEALARAGAQVLDLEVLAAHRGSVLGDLPDEPQPSQKHFETKLWTALSQFDPARPVFVESESKKVGDLRVPEALIERMRGSKCFRLEADVPTRVALLREDYAHFVGNPETLADKLEL